MKKITPIIFTLLFLILLSAPSFAQSSAAAKNILDKASKAFQESEGVKLSFILTPDSPDGGAFEPQKGVAFVKGNKFKLDMPSSTTWFDGTTQWVLLKDANEVNISSPTAQELISISPLGLLNMYKQNYYLDNPVKSTYNGKAIKEIKMTPKDNKQEFKDIIISIDNTTNSIVMLRFTTNNGNNHKLSILEYESNHKFSNDLFKFNKNNHPGVEIIDLR